MNEPHPPPYPYQASWRPHPERFAPQPGQVHIFRLALDLPKERITQLASLLSQDEEARAGRYHLESRRQHFIAAHGQLRCILADCLQVAPAAVSFSYSPHGKPALIDAPWLQFNLSHSTGLGLLAVCAGQALGVDVERIRPEIERDNIAQRFFAPAEVTALHALPPEQQLQAFFACWTRKEAYIKARGLGLSIPLDQFVVSLAPDEPARLLAREPGAPDGPFTLAAIDPGPGLVAAVAVEGHIAELYLWDWNGNELA